MEGVCLFPRAAPSELLRGEFEDRPELSRSFGIGRAKQAPIGARDEGDSGLCAVRANALCAEAVQRRQSAAWSDLKDCPGIAGAASHGGPINVSISGERECTVRGCIAFYAIRHMYNRKWRSGNLNLFAAVRVVLVRKRTT